MNTIIKIETLDGVEPSELVRASRVESKESVADILKGIQKAASEWLGEPVEPEFVKGFKAFKDIGSDNRLVVVRRKNNLRAFIGDEVKSLEWQVSASHGGKAKLKEIVLDYKDFLGLTKTARKKLSKQ